MSQQPDEGYSEDPLNPPTTAASFSYKARDNNSALASLRASSPSQFTGWLSTNLPSLSTEVKTRKFNCFILAALWIRLRVAPNDVKSLLTQ